MATKDERIIEIVVNGQKANANLKEMEGAARALSSQLKTLAPGTAEFVEKSAQLREVRSRMDGVKASINEVTQATSFMGKSFSGALSLVMSGGIQGAISQVFALGQSIFDTSAHFETYGAVMENALGSKSAAQGALADIQKMAAATPFSVDELTGSFIKFVNRGLNPSMVEMGKMADLAASQGKSFDQLTEAVLDAGGGEFERLKEFGIKASKSGDQVSFSFKGMQQTVANTPEAINAAIMAFGEMKGVAGSTAAIAETMEGQLSNLGDTADQVKIQFGQGLRPVFVAVLSTLGFFLGMLKELPSFVKENRGALLALAGAVLMLNAPLIQTNYELVKNAALSKSKQVWDWAVTASTGAWTLATQGLNVALRANPIGAVVAVGTVLLGLLVMLYDKSEKFRGAVAGMGAALKAFAVTYVQGVMQQLRGLGNVLAGILTADPAQIKKGLDGIGQSLQTMYWDAGKNAGAAYNRGYNEKVAEGVKDNTALIRAYLSEGLKKQEAAYKAQQEAAAKAKAQALKDQEAGLKERLAKVQEGSELEMRLKQKLVTNEAAQQLLDVKKTAAERRVIEAEAEQKRVKLAQEYYEKAAKERKKHQQEVDKARKDWHAATVKADQEFQKLKVEAMAEGIEKELAKLKLQRDEELRALDEKKRAVLANTTATEQEKAHLLDQYRQTASMAQARYDQAVKEARAKQDEKDRKDEFARLDGEEEEKLVVLDNAWLEQKGHLKKQTVEFMAAEQARADAELKLRKKTAQQKLALLVAAGKGETAEAKKLKNAILRIDGDIAEGQETSEKDITKFKKDQAQARADFEMDMASAKVELGEQVLDSVMEHMDKESEAYAVAQVVRKGLALAEIAVNLQKQLSNIATTATAMDVALPGSGIVYRVVQSGLAIAGAAAAATKVAGFDQGGYTGPGQGQADGSGHRVAGVVHENEWVAPKWMLAQPKYANVIGYLEAERRSGGSSPASLPPSAADGGSQAPDMTAALLQQLIGVVSAQSEKMNSWQQRLGVDYHAGSAEKATTLHTQLRRDAGLSKGG